MNAKKISALFLVGCLLAGTTGCGNKNGAVFVQSVSALSGMGGIAPGDKFAGMVVSEHVTEIQRDSDKSIQKLFVREGDDVKKGQDLFSYDTEELKLTLEKQKLQQEQLEATIENLNKQIEELTKERDRSSGRTKLEYTIQIQTNQIDLKENELNLKAKKEEVTKSKKILKNATITSPVDGRIQSINEGENDANGKPQPYVVIQQAGAYRVKGTLNELQRGSIMEGDRILLQSRTDDRSWTGTVSLVDYENPTTGNSGNMYGAETDQMTSSSKYPFYIELDSSDGMILGQHLYLMLDPGEENVSGLCIGSSFVCFDDNNNAYVWAESHGRLEKRTVTIGEYKEGRDVYPILSGLTENDYVAFPDPEICRSGVRVTHTAPPAETTAAEPAAASGAMPGPNGAMAGAGEIMSEGGGFMFEDDGIMLEDDGILLEDDEMEGGV